MNPKSDLHQQAGYDFKALLPEHDAQLINYLRATRKRVGYLINFGAFPRLEWKRLVL